MAATKLETYEAKALKIIEEAKKEKIELENNIKTLDDEIEALYIKQNECSKGSSFDEYTGIIEEIEAKKRELEFNMLKLKRINSRDLITADEYKKTVKGILSSFEEEKKKILQNIISHCENLLELGNSLKELAHYTNLILKLYQSDLYDNKDRYKNKDGECILQDQAQVPKDTGYIIHFAQTPCESFMYEKISGEEKKNKEVFKTWIH